MAIDLKQFHIDPYQFGLDLVRKCSQSLRPQDRPERIQDHDPEERDCQPGYQKKWEGEK